MPAAPALLDGTPPDGFSNVPTGAPMAYLGLVCPYNVWSLQHLTADPLDGRTAPERAIIRVGAHQECLAAIAGGTHKVPLILDHNERCMPLASTEDGSLRFFPRTDGLYFSLHVVDSTRLEAARRDHPRVSKGSKATREDCKLLLRQCEFQTVVDVEWLMELSLVATSAFQTWWAPAPLAR